jgi:MscS family membrane protein
MNEAIDSIFFDPQIYTLNNMLIAIGAFFILFIIVSSILFIVEYVIKYHHKNAGIKLSFYRSIRIIILYILWIYFIKICVDITSSVYLNEYIKQITTLTKNIFEFSIYVVIIINIFKFIAKAKAIVIEKNRRNDGGYDDFRDINAVFKAIELLAVIISIVLILAAFDIPLTALGAFSGVAIAGLTLSQSTLLTNLFGGLVITFNRKYSEGDIIRSDISSSVKFSGVVKRIGILTTQVDSYDTMPMHIPNSIFLSNGITNASRRTHRRMIQYFTIGYNDLNKYSEIKKELVDILMNHDDVDNTKTVAVSLVDGATNMGSRIESAYSTTGINIQIYVLINKVSYTAFLEAQDDIMIKVANVLMKNNVAFTINHIFINNDTRNQLVDKN